MSYANLFSGNKIAPQYLPTEATATPTLSQVLTAGSTANGQNITGVTQLTINPGNVPAGPNSGIGSLQIYNTSQSANPSYFHFYNGAVASGGLNPGDLQLFGYAGPGFVAKQVFNATPNGDLIQIGDATPGGTVVNINGNTGAGRVYDSRYNLPPFQFNANVPSVSLSKGSAQVSGINCIQQVTYTTGSAGIDALLVFPSPGVINQTIGVVFTSVSSIGSGEQVQVTHPPVTGPGPFATIALLSPDTLNKVYWFVNTGPDTWLNFT